MPKIPDVAEAMEVALPDALPEAIERDDTSADGITTLAVPQQAPACPPIQAQGLPVPGQWPGPVTSRLLHLQQQGFQVTAHANAACQVHVATQAALQDFQMTHQCQPLAAAPVQQQAAPVQQYTVAVVAQQQAEPVQEPWEPAAPVAPVQQPWQPAAPVQQLAPQLAAAPAADGDLWSPDGPATTIHSVRGERDFAVTFRCTIQSKCNGFQWRSRKGIGGSPWEDAKNSDGRK